MLPVPAARDRLDRGEGVPAAALQGVAAERGQRRGRAGAGVDVQGGAPKALHSGRGHRLGHARQPRGRVREVPREALPGALPQRRERRRRRRRDHGALGGAERRAQRAEPGDLGAPPPPGHHTRPGDAPRRGRGRQLHILAAGGGVRGGGEGNQEGEGVRRRRRARRRRSRRRRRRRPRGGTGSARVDRTAAGC